MKQATKRPSAKTVQALLEKHACPVPFHEVRTRFLGSIATPVVWVSPVQIVEDLWDGELPTFDNIDAVNELLGILLRGLWNDLTRHQKRSQPFRLTRMTVETAEDLGRYGLVRLQELDGFIEGLFNGEDVIELPERAHEAVERLAEMRAMMAGICELFSQNPHLGARPKIETSVRLLRQMTRVMEAEIHEAVLSCNRARLGMMESVFTEKPTVH